MVFEKLVIAFACPSLHTLCSLSASGLALRQATVVRKRLVGTSKCEVEEDNTWFLCHCQTAWVGDCNVRMPWPNDGSLQHYMIYDRKCKGKSTNPHLSCPPKHHSWSGGVQRQAISGFSLNGASFCKTEVYYIRIAFNACVMIESSGLTSNQFHCDTGCCDIKLPNSPHFLCPHSDHDNLVWDADTASRSSILCCTHVPDITIWEAGHTQTCMPTNLAACQGSICLSQRWGRVQDLDQGNPQGYRSPIWYIAFQHCL